MKRKIIILSLVSFTTVSGLCMSFMCEDETVAPGTSKRCITKVVNFYPKADGTTKLPEFTYGNVPANAQGKCPDPVVEYKNQ